MAAAFHELVRRYVEAWNDPDPGRRHAQLSSLYAEDSSIVTTQGGASVGLDAVIDHIGAVFDQFIEPGRYRFATGGAVAHHEGALFRWEMRNAVTDELADAGVNFFRLSSDGRIASDHQFTLGVDSSLGTSPQIIR